MEKYSFDGFTPKRQPDSPVDFSLATTSTAASGNNQFGYMNNQTMFTKEAYDLTFSRMTAGEVSQLLRAVTGKSSYQFHYFSPYYGEWRTAPFYVANNKLSVKCVREGNETFTNISFHTTGINPL